MSIASAITTKQSQVAAAYTACNNKGATMPVAGSQNLSNLATTISSISTGGGAANLTSLSVTPSTSAQQLTPTSPVDGWDEVNVSAVTSSIDSNIVAGNIKSGVSILGVTGTCPGNFVSGSFTTNTTAGAQSITIPYTGTGYPIAAMVFVTGGAHSSNSDWYDAVQRYAVGFWAMHKSHQATTPTYTTSGNVNYGNVLVFYKNSASSATTWARGGDVGANTYSSSNAANAAYTCCRFKSSTSLSVYVATSSYGLLPGLSYTYFIIYSS